jgi:hypothetical protein
MTPQISLHEFDAKQVGDLDAKAVIHCERSYEA